MPTHCQVVLGKGTLHTLLGLCGPSELKAQGCQEEGVLLQSALGPAGFRSPTMSISELSARTEVTY